jgi:hypothetical protein
MGLLALGSEVCALLGTGATWVQVAPSLQMQWIVPRKVYSTLLKVSRHVSAHKSAWLSRARCAAHPP